jgi:hypothetical protein
VPCRNGNDRGTLIRPQLFQRHAFSLSHHACARAATQRAAG